MKNANHLKIDKSLKKLLNNNLKEFRNNRFSETLSIKKSANSGTNNIFSLLFKEYDNVNDLVKDFSSQLGIIKRRTVK